MADDSIPARSGGQTITAQFFNLLRKVLGGDHVPRNSSGVATDAAGSLGDATRGWTDLFFTNTTNEVRLKEALGKLQVFIDGTQQGEFDTTGFIRKYLSPFGHSLSSVSSLTKTATDNTFADVVTQSFTASGKRPVMVALYPAATGTYSDIRLEGQYSNLGIYKFTRDSTDLHEECIIEITGTDTGNDLTLRLPPTAFWAIDFAPPAGTYTYRFKLKNNNAVTGGNAQFANIKMLVYEVA